MKTKHPIIEMNGILGKYCSKCNEWNPLEKYPKDNRAKDGRGAQCNICGRVRSKASYRNNPTAKLEKSKEWNRNHPDRMKLATQKYLQLDANRAKKIQATRNWRSVDREKKLARRRELYGETAEENREETNRKQREYRNANIETIRAKDRARYAKNPSIKLKSAKKWRAKNPTAVKKMRSEYYIDNLEKIIQRTRNWRKNNPLKKSAINHARRAREKNGGKWTAEEWVWLFNLVVKSCVKCGATDCKFNKDHIKPICMGGQNIIDNLQPLCELCHREKPRKETIDYRPMWLIENFAKLKIEAGLCGACDTQKVLEKIITY